MIFFQTHNMQNITLSAQLLSKFIRLILGHSGPNYSYAALCTKMLSVKSHGVTGDNHPDSL